jgi:protein TonB
MKPLPLIGVAALVAGCSTPLPPAPWQSSAPPHPDSAAEGAPVQSVALTVDGYKRDVARAIYRNNPENLFDGAPPPTLRAVVVLSIHIDPAGRPLRLAVLRSNGYRELEEIALASVRRAAPLPMPNRLIARNGEAEFVETWLFRDDGRFQIRSLAEAQATLED